jgi:hypothetical protein
MAVGFGTIDSDGAMLSEVNKDGGELSGIQ